MKQLLPPANAAFDASAQTITFSTTIPATISHILHVTNVTRGVILFQPQAGTGLSGTYASPVLTLNFDTTTYADADKLEIFYDDALTSTAVTGTFWQATQPVSGPLTDTELRATAVPVSGTVTATTGGLTDTQLRATPVPVSGTVTATTGGLTDAELRATPVPVSGTVTATTGGLTDTQLRASDVKITLDGEAVVLGAGSAAIGKLAANSGVDIGDVDVTSVSGNVTVVQGTATSLKAQAEAYQGGSAVASGNPLEVNLRTSTVAVATSTKQSDGTQKTQVVDGSGNVIGSTTNALDVNIKSNAATNQSVNVAQLAGTTTDTNSGNKSAGTLRVVLATDQPALTNKLLVTPDANSTVDLNKIAGNTTSTGNGTAGTGCQRVTIASDNTAFAVTTNEVPDATATYAPSNVSSTAYEASHLIKNGAGVLFSFTCYSSRTSGQWVQVHNATAVPSDTSVPTMIFWVPANSNASWDGGKFGQYFSTGIAFCNSSTGPTKTIGSADTWFSVNYK